MLRAPRLLFSAAAPRRAALPLRAPLRSLCAEASSSAAPPVVLMQPPPISTRRERIKEHGLIALTLEHTKQQVRAKQGEAGTTDTSFRVQTFTVPLGRPAEFAISNVYGFGRARSKWLAAEVGVFGHYKLSKMRESQRAYLRRALNAACNAYDDPRNAAGAALKKEIGHNIQRLKDIRCYRGIRHELRYPCRGQCVCDRANARPHRAAPPVARFRRPRTRHRLRAMLTAVHPGRRSSRRRTKGNARTRRRMTHP
jgi:small subunit ribosomal protein S13